MVVDRARVRRALVNHRADPGRYAELTTLAELLAGLTIANQAGLTDSTEMAVTDTPGGSSLLTVAEAAAVAGVTRAALYRAVSEGRLIAATNRPYLIAPAALAAYLRKAA
ncbi:helix-turn-helix domain-containing protein [Nonomuraea cavernae]|nr:helix-turn-helix domain-containing protein [Nonomuraea cavernae]MCA2190955.1 helix-turn-helix domain-containing protein [Nonomuraea cavernae]